MAGKPYSIKEMKNIVDFIIENRAYGEVRGRKKWMELAGSKLTTRTWQSLKETFLKRILPDIHNPYYKLTPTQVRSFREGREIATASQNKLEIRTISDDSSSNVDKDENIKIKRSKNESKTKGNEEIRTITDDDASSNVDKDENIETKTSKNETKTNGNEENPPGETIKCANVPSHSRSSVETLVLDSDEGDERLTCDVEALEEISGKSIRDCITYSEPLTPMMQQVMEDFASDDEGRLEIDERIPDDNAENTNFEVVDNGKNKETNEQSTSTDVQINDEIQQPTAKDVQIDDENEPNFNKPQENGLQNEKENLTEKKSVSPKKLAITQDKTCADITDSIDKTKESQSQLNTNTSTDTTIPNNQESLAPKKAYKSEGVEKVEENNNNLKNKPSRKRSISHSSEGPKSKKQISKKVKEAEKTKTDSPSTQDSATIENPCLKSVSLYAEQFTPTNYLNSESSTSGENTCTVVEHEETEIIPKVQKNIIKKTIVLKSHSESENESQEVPNKQQYEIKHRKKQIIAKTTNRKLAGVFGFSSGAVHKKTKHRRSHNWSPQRYYHVNETSELSSSEWFSESDGEFVSPPRRSKSKYPKKYLKPNSARIASLEEEGGLFVMYGKKIYPLVKDGKIIKNYVNYLAEDDPEEDGNTYWRDKYVEERKKSMELSKLLSNAKQSKETVPQIEELPGVSNQKSPSLPSIQNPPETTKETATSNKNTETKTSSQSTNKTVKIKFTKKDEEVQLEGHWSQLEPVLKQVVGILHKDDNSSTKDSETSNKADKTEKNCEMEMKSDTSSGALSTVDIISSRSTSPIVDKVTQRKVDKIESSIFKKIEAIDKADKSADNVNVSTRRPRPLRSAMSSESSSKVSKASNEERKEELNVSKQNGGSNETPGVVKNKRGPNKKKRKTDTPKKSKDSTPKKTRQLYKSNLDRSFDDDADDTAILYKFPSPPPSNKKLDNTDKNKVHSKIYNTRSPNSKMTSPDTASQNSIESSQGYQDSDNSVQLYRLKRKRKHSSSSISTVCTLRSKLKTRRKSTSQFVVETVSDTSTVHQSDSYQLLLPKKRSMKRLESIEENKPVILITRDNLSEDHINSYISSDNSVISNVHNEEPSSINGCECLPMSPELSIVENFSFNKSSFNDIDNVPTLNEALNNEKEVCNNNNKYEMIQVDATMPLIDQYCGVTEKNELPNTSTNKSEAESLLQKCNTVELSEITSPPDGLHKKLHDLLLDSAKKLVNHVNHVLDNAMEVDSSYVKEVPKKITKKRCSTPRKKSEGLKPRKRKAPNKEPVIEESVQYCANDGRKSCPPTIVAHIEDSKVEKTESEPKTKKTGKTQKRKPKKDIIKVKILRPRNKSPIKPQSKSDHKDSSKDPSSLKPNTETQSKQLTVESGIFPNSESNDSVDLVHNHSETCLLANECIDNSSIEFITSTNSPIFINSDSVKLDEEVFYDSIPDCANLTPDMFCNNAQDETRFKRSKSIEPDTQESKHDLTFNTPLVSEPSSLITEDLSDQSPSPKRSKWYLLSEDDTTNVPGSANTKTGNGLLGLTRNLKHLFPIVCAVPDLSTITESSKDNDSRKADFKTNGENNNDSVKPIS